jgi:hypothetical protein
MFDDLSFEMHTPEEWLKVHCSLSVPTHFSNTQKENLQKHIRNGFLSVEIGNGSPVVF